MFPGQLSPSIAHAFIKLLHAKGILLRVYTQVRHLITPCTHPPPSSTPLPPDAQNIDGLEALAGIPPERIVACHGSLASGTVRRLTPTPHSPPHPPHSPLHPPHTQCMRCGAKYDQQWMRAAVGPPAPSSCGAVDEAAVPIPRCSASTPSGETCSGVVKPDITFFEEALPRAFTRQHKADMASADCVLVLGTSLSVQPVSSLPSRAGPAVPRALLNNEPVQVWRKGGDADAQGGWGGAVNPFLFGHPENYRDVLLLGDVDEAAAALAIAAGWEVDLAQQVTESRKHAALQATGVERDPSSPPPGREVQEALVAGRRLLAQWRALPGGQAALPEDFSDSEGAAGAMGSTGASGAAPPGAQEPAALATAENPSKPTCPLPPYRNVDSANTPSGRAGAKTHGLSELEIAMGLDDDEWA